MVVLHDGSLTLGGIVLGESDAFGTEWFLESPPRGWSDSAPSTGTVDQRASSHGGWITPAFYAARLIEVEGSLLTADWGSASLALDRLMDSIPLDLPTTMLVNEGARTLQADVRQDGDPLVERRDGWARFSLSLIAPDPRRYSTTLQSASTGLPITTGGLVLPIVLPIVIGATVTSGRLILTNDGNNASPPTITITGPCPPCTITHLGTGRRLVVVDAVDAGRTLTIDTANSTALLDGTTLRTVTGSWFHIEPGPNEIAFSATAYDAGALLTISFRSAWK